MMRSLYSGVSGLRNHQTRMDVIGNNISNVNTVGFKSSRVIFQDVYSQTSKSASAGIAGTVGGTNPMQIGLGVTLAAIDVLHTQSATQRTDRALDLMIQGEGFFVVDTNGDEAGGLNYTRAGNFYLDNAGNLVNSSGYYVMGYKPDTTTGNPPEATTDGEDRSEHLTTLNMALFDDIYIDETGAIKGIQKTDAATTDTSLDAANDGLEVTIGFVAISTFTNVSGLEKQGNSLYSETGNSGAAFITAPSMDGAGAVVPGALEMSNVDLAAEFTDMIVTQRGFQANSRVITTTDSMLEELVNLKR